MKAKLSLLAAACLFAIGPALTAADDQAKPADKKDPAKTENGKCQCDQKAKQPEKKTVMLTGSNIPQTVTQTGRITNGAEPLTTLSHEDLENTGEMNLAGALRKAVPSIH
jgi:hypothetical protein